MVNSRPVDEEGVAALARAAGLPLAPDRLPLIAGQLGEWLAAANELSRMLADERHLEVTPIAVFAHPANAEPVE
jgi:hypothetical protein